MRIVIGNVLNEDERRTIYETLLTRPELFRDGKATAGWHARDVKNNLQAAPSRDTDRIIGRIREALLAHGVFTAAARPKAITALLLSRYEPGMEYGLHVDDAMMGGKRADLSFTYFLSPRDSYDGGELMIESGMGEDAIGLEAGQLVLYPSSTLHRVNPVSRGVRLAAVGWVRSLVRSHEQREILFDLEVALREVYEREGKTALFDRLVKSRSNLLRLWSED
jgi:PKHD-type hydroxylase